MLKHFLKSKNLKKAVTNSGFYSSLFISSPPLDLSSAVLMWSNYQRIFPLQVKVIMKLLLQVIVYSLWRERNGRIFREISHRPTAFFRIVDRQMRDRLLSLTPAPSDAHSLLELLHSRLNQSYKPKSNWRNHSVKFSLDQTLAREGRLILIVKLVCDQVFSSKDLGEVQVPEEEALIAAYRKEIEDTMEIVREEMKLLAEVDQPGSMIENYVTEQSFVLSQKAAGLVSLQARLARFQHRLKEQEILSRKRVPPR
uniref:Uncharacterized protein n=1 Tax=Brassica oleracea var. oleracea TaxID=109376 RepID=A0A0D3AD40_BRAOL